MWGRRLLRRIKAPTTTLPFNLADADSPRWDERAETAVALLAEQVGEVRRDAGVALRIADFGAGTERLRDVLETHLEEPHTYSPFDLHPQSDTVAAMDVARELPDAAFDVVFCLGLLEYIEGLEPFLATLSQRYATLVLSYAVFDAPHPLTPQERPNAVGSPTTRDPGSSASSRGSPFAFVTSLSPIRGEPESRVLHG